MKRLIELFEAIDQKQNLQAPHVHKYLTWDEANQRYERTHYLMEGEWGPAVHYTIDELKDDAQSHEEHRTKERARFDAEWEKAKHDPAERKRLEDLIPYDNFEHDFECQWIPA